MSTHSSRNYLRLCFVSLCAFLPFSGATTAQDPGNSVGRPPGPDAMFAPVLVEVSVREANGTPLSSGALVRLYSFSGFNRTSATQDAAMATFPDVIPGEYEIEVQSAGYQKATEHASVMGGGLRVTFYVYLKNEGDPIPSSGPALTPLITPKLQGEIDKALQKMRKQQYEEALRDLEKAAKIAPGNPDIHYLMGMANSGLRKPDAARAEFEAALAILPTHERALLALGELQLRTGQAALAAETLEKNFQANGGDWRSHFLLATACFETKNYGKAVTHIDRAIELNKGKNPSLRVLRGRILAAEGRVAEARLVFEEIARESPDDPAGAAAQLRLTELSKPVSKPPQDSDAFVIPGSLPLPFAKQALPEKVHRWAPPDIDSMGYPLASGVACPEEEVLARAQMRMKKQLANFERFTATERIVHTEVDSAGIPQSPREKDFAYMVILSHPGNGFTYLEESRDGGENLSQFPTTLATKGLVSLGVAVLDRNYERDFDFSCDGLTTWRGEPAWAMRFEQRKNIPSRILIWRNLRGSFPISLRGRLWLGANTYDLLHMETDLREPVLPLELSMDHLTIDYGPVRFEHAQTELWLPWHANAYMELHGRRYHHSHTLTNYMLFSVETTNKVAAPKESPENPQ